MISKVSCSHSISQLFAGSQTFSLPLLWSRWKGTLSVQDLYNNVTWHWMPKPLEAIVLVKNTKTVKNYSQSNHIQGLLSKLLIFIGLVDNHALTYWSIRPKLLKNYSQFNDIQGLLHKWHIFIGLVDNQTQAAKKLPKYGKIFSLV